MHEYDVICESLQTLINNDEITLEFAEEVNDLAYEKYVVEAANAQYRNQLNDIKGMMKNCNQRYKAAMKAGNKKEAIKQLTLSKACIKKATEYVNSVDSDAMDVFLPMAVAFLKSIGTMVAANIAVQFVPKLNDKTTYYSMSLGKNGKVLDQNAAGKVAAIVAWATQVAPVVNNMIKKLRSSDKVNMNDLNLYRTKVVKQLKMLEKEVDKKIASIK